MEIKWIKITTDIFDDEKIQIIETLPEADSIIVIWFKLLVLAGKSNNNGVFMLSSNIPYTDEMLAIVFRRKVTTVRLALDTFQKFGMIEIVDNVVTIPKWEKHQNIDGLEKIRKQTRDRVASYRNKQLQIAKCNVTDNVTVTDGNATDKDKDKDKDKDIKNNISKSKKETKHQHGEYNHVLLSDTEYNKLLTDWGEEKLKHMIQVLDEGIEAKGYKYKNYAMALRTWEKNEKQYHSSRNSMFGDSCQNSNVADKYGDLI